LRIFAAAAALLVGQRSMKDILSPRALPQRQISGNAPFPIYEIGSKPVKHQRALKKMALPSALHYQSRTMKQKLIILLVLTLFAWSPVFSAADTPETRRKEAERYLQVSPPKALFEDMADKMAANIPADQRDQFKKLMTTQVDIAALSKAMIDAMVKNFTTEELKALADFYGSPVGKSAMQKFGAYMADIMPVVQAEIMKAASKMNH
jgi:hypothetical protein